MISAWGSVLLVRLSRRAARHGIVIDALRKWISCNVLVCKWQALLTWRFGFTLRWRRRSQLHGIFKDIWKIVGSWRQLLLAGAASRSLHGACETVLIWCLWSVVHFVARASMKEWRWHRHLHVWSVARRERSADSHHCRSLF